MTPQARLRLLALTALLIAPIVASAEDGPADGVLTPELLVDLAVVDDVALSADGSTVAYTLTAPRAEGDEPGNDYKHLYLVDATQGEPRRFTAGKERIGAPAFSPDGKVVSFLVERGAIQEGTQIWTISREGGEAQLLSHHDGSIDSYSWSPDGRQIAYAARDAESAQEKEDKEAGKDWTVEKPGPSSNETRFRHLHVLDLDSGESRRLIRDDLDVFQIHWTPDSQALIFQATTTAHIDDEYMNTGIYTLAAGGGVPRVLTPTEGKLAGMAISPDGSQLAWLGAVSRNDPIAQSVFVMPLAGGEARNLSEGYEGSGERLLWREDGSLLLLSAEGERHVLYTVDTGTGTKAPVALPHLIVSDLDAAGGKLAMAAHSPEHPAEVFVASGEGEPRRLSHSNPQLDNVRLARQEVFEWTGPDDWTIRGVLTYPRDYTEGERYPLVLQVHGGPEGVSLDGWTTRAGYPVQLLAAAGYMVLEPNYRGSMGRGVAFSKADHDDLGGKEFDDILAGVDALIERGMVDPDRVGTGGWSYGGYMSAWAATRWTERFNASVVAAGLTNWLSFAGTTDIPNEMSVVHWNNWWFDHPELHWERSPMAHLNQARTPTLVVTGAEDERVHPEQARQLFTGLRIKGVPTELVFYPREGHGLDERAHQLDFIERTLGWFDQHLGVPKVGGVTERRD